MSFLSPKNPLFIAFKYPPGIGLWLAAAVLCARGELPVMDASPLLGTSGHGHVYPGAAVPFGFVQVSPDTMNVSWDGCSGYNHADTNLLGFSFNHLTGTGCPDMGNILLMPVVGDLKLLPENIPAAGLPTRFSHEQETARPGYYRVFLPEYRVNVELTATVRAGLQRYTFPAAKSAHVILDLWHGLGNQPTDAGVTIENDRSVSGYRKSISTACLHLGANSKEYYFVAEFSRPFASAGIWLDGRDLADLTAHGRDVKAHFDYQTKDRDQMTVRLGLSTVSVEGARKNLRSEMGTWNFEAVASAASRQWNQTLGKIQVETADADLKKTFYTALYHSQLAPITYSDVDGQFRGPDNQVHQTGGFDYYTDLSLWDTFRAEQPLLTLLQPHRVNDIVRTMLLHYQLLGKQMLPLETFGGRESYAMIGNPSIPVIAEAYAKGLRDWDTHAALAAMVGASEREDEQNAAYTGFGAYRRQGWIPSKPYDGDGHPGQSVSKVLELAYDDACVARFARQLGRKDIAGAYARRSTNWLNVFDAATGFMRGRNADGSWVTPFDPCAINFADYTEANAWQYTFFVPHNVPALIQALGGDRKFVAKLDELFDTTKTLPGSLNDVSGLIGMYDQGNEPSHNFAYLYSYAGQPWKTQARIRQIASTQYSGMLDGLCGNDDCGQMSAWYVFAALGFYPVDPASGVYVIGSPLVDKATILLDRKYHRGRTFTVVAEHNSALNKYIQSARLNGHDLPRSWISHDEITAGGKLVLIMGPAPNPTWASAPADRPAQALALEP